MNFLNTIKKEINIKFIIVAVFSEALLLLLTLLGGWVFYKNWPAIKDWQATYKICGLVLEYGSGASVPDTRLDFENHHLYSLYDGSYCFDNLSLGSRLTINLPEIYEADKTLSPDYSQYKELSFFKRQLTHNWSLVLGVDATANRLFGFIKQGSFDNIWLYLTPESRYSWSSKPADFNKALSLERSLRSKLDKSQVVDFQIISSQAINEELYQYEVKWERANGTFFTQTETFEKMDGWWHYVFPHLPKEVYDYIYITQKTLK